MITLILMLFGCQNNLQLYPSEDRVIQYHSKWTKIHYPKRIKVFMNDPLERGDIVFLGNSITEQGGDWGAKFDRTDIKNRGIGGDVTDGVLARLGEICHARPKAVFLLIGINDINNWNNEWGIPSPEYVGNNIPKIAAAIHKGSPKTKIYVQTVLPTDLDAVKDAIRTVNGIIKSHEPDGHYQVIDLYSDFADENGLIKPELTTDGVHLTKEGYDLWVKLVGDYIK
jgi:lysophospholipase L1-like esterase